MAKKTNNNENGGNNQPKVPQHQNGGRIDEQRQSGTGPRVISE